MSWLASNSGSVADSYLRSEVAATPPAVAGSRHRRVLALVDLASRGEQVIRHAANFSPSGDAALLAVHVIDGRSTFESDGPCGYFLATERFGRRIPGVAQRLDLLLARNQAAWAESAVLVADGYEPLSGLIERWQPDLIVTDRRSAAQSWAAPALGRFACEVEIVDAGGARPSPRRPVSELPKGEQLMKNPTPAGSGDDRRTQIARTAFLGLATLLLYVLLFANEGALLQLSSQGKWYFLLPIVIAFVFSFFHGAFTAGFWDALGIKASGKKG